MLGPLLSWMLSGALGPAVVERLIDRVGDRDDWAQRVMKNLDQSVPIRRRPALRAWLESSDVSLTLLEGDADRVAALSADLAATMGMDGPAAARLMDDIAGIFLQSLDPSTAVAVTAFRQAGEIHAVHEALAELQAALAQAAQQPQARSAYGRVVEQIAPDLLLERTQELAELGRFATAAADDDPAYSWWLGEKWAGKSALLATFALNPPPGIDILAFFVTARLGSYDTRSAFVEIVQEQLDTFLAQPASTWPASLRESHFLDDLARAALLASERGRRLVLVVDGLDEDRRESLSGSGLLSPGQHSIAALLPKRPPHGMRIIVAGRPHPPIPRDVPDDHPLRSAEIRRPLPLCETARATKDAQLSELHRILHSGDPLQVELLGLITAARGGLDRTDLENLTGASPWAIHTALTGVTGRTFSTRPGRWNPDRQTYLLGHDDLQETAIAHFGWRLTNYEDALHAWADEYRDRGWPAGTPEYLLRGYFRLLETTGDMDRLVRLSHDTERHQRMLDVSGGDASALDEVARTHHLLCSQRRPDLASALRLARHRNALEDRHAHTPTDLPAAWAVLGHPARGEALALSIPNPYHRVRALIAVFEAVVDAGDTPIAGQVVRHAERSIPQITNFGDQIWVCLDLTTALIKAQYLAWAEELAITLTPPLYAVSLLHGVVRAFADAGDLIQARRVAERAEQMADTLHGLPARDDALSRLVPVLVDAGNIQRAKHWATAIMEPSLRSHAWNVVNRGSGSVERVSQDAGLVPDGTPPHKHIDKMSGESSRPTNISADGPAGPAQPADPGGMSADPVRAVETLIARVELLGKGGDMSGASQVANRAEQIATAITNSRARIRSLARLIQTLTAIGDARGARGVADRVEEIVAGETEPQYCALVLGELIRPLLDLGDLPRARRVVERTEKAVALIGNWEADEEAFIALVQALIIAGEFSVAERTAATATSDFLHGWTLIGMVEALTGIGEYDRAEYLASTITDPETQIRGVTALIHGLVGVQALPAACRITEEAVQTISAIEDPRSRRELLNELMWAGAAALDQDAVQRVMVRVAGAIVDGTDPEQQAWLLIALAQQLARLGDVSGADAIAARVEQIVDTASSSAQRPPSAPLIHALVAAGDFERLQQIAVAYPQSHSEIVTAAVKNAVAARDFEEAEQLVAALTPAYARTEPLQALVDGSIAVGELERAERAAAAITAPYDRSEALSAVARELATAGDLPAARRVADQAQQAAAIRLRESHLEIEAMQQRDALAALVPAFAAVGEFERAEQAALTITKPDLRAQALAALASHLHRIGATTNALRVLVQATGFGRWHQTLSVAGLLDRHAILDLAESRV